MELRGVALQREHTGSRHIMSYLICSSVQPVAGVVRTGLHSPWCRREQEKTEPKSSVFFACGGAEGSCLTARAHGKQGDLHKFLSARACSLSRAQSAQGCTSLGYATKIIKKTSIAKHSACFRGGAEGSCLTARAHGKQGDLHKFLSARACSLSRA